MKHKIKSIGIIGTGKVGRGAGYTLTDNLIDEIFKNQKCGVENIYLSNRTHHKAETLRDLIEGRISSNEDLKKKITIAAIRYDYVHDVFEKSDLVFICAGKKIGDYKIRNKRNFLEQEQERINKLKNKLKKSGDASLEKQIEKAEEELSKAKKIKVLIEQAEISYDKEFRIYSRLAYTFPIIADLAERAKKAKVKKGCKAIVLSAPTELNAYLFESISGIISFGMNHYDTYRLHTIPLKKKLKAFGDLIKRKNLNRKIFECMGDHGGGTVITSGSIAAFYPKTDFKNLKFNGWKKLAGEFINALPDEINITEILQKTIIDYPEYFKGDISATNSGVFEDFWRQLFNQGELELAPFLTLKDLEKAGCFDKNFIEQSEEYQQFRDSEDKGMHDGVITKEFITQLRELEPMATNQFIFNSYIKLHRLRDVLIKSPEIPYFTEYIDKPVEIEQTKIDAPAKTISLEELFETFLEETPYRLRESYNFSRTLINNLQYGVEDILKLVDILKKYEKNPSFKMTGYLISALLNKQQIDEWITLDFNWMNQDTEFNGLGFFNHNNLLIKGKKLTDYIGAYNSGKIIVEPEIRDFGAYKMSDGEFIAKGIAGNYFFRNASGGRAVAEKKVRNSAGSGISGKAHLILMKGAKDQVGYQQDGNSKIIVNGPVGNCAVEEQRNGLIEFNDAVLDSACFNKQGGISIFKKGAGIDLGENMTGGEIDYYGLNSPNLSPKFQKGIVKYNGKIIPGGHK